MRVALLTTFVASKKEPLAELLDRVHAAFEASGLGAPDIRFSLADGLVPGGVSSVDRVLKRFPQMQPFLTTATLPGFSGSQRLLSNAPSSATASQTLDFQTLRDIAAGVPKSFPFYSITINLRAAAFGDEGQPTARADMAPGVTVGDNWWVNGRLRSVTALTVVEAGRGNRQLPSPSAPVAAVLAACGKVKSTKQVPLAASGAPAPAATAAPPLAQAAPGAAAMAVAPPETLQAVADIVRDYRTRIGDIVARAGLPHDLPSTQEALATRSLGEASGPMKPALQRAFKALGYDCKSEAQGTFTLRRRTPGHLTVELSLDVGTWSRSVTVFYRVHGLGFTARLPLSVAPRALAGQYPIGGPERWQQIVDNLAALVAELDRSFVPAIEAAAGPSPEWYRPAS